MNRAAVFDHWITIVVVSLFLVFTKVSLGQEDEPSLKILPFGDQQLKALKDNLILTCIAENVDLNYLSDLTWTGPDNQPIPKENRKYTESFSEDRMMLFIKDIQENDKGTYYCTAKYSGGLLQAQVTLDTFLDITWQDAPPEQHAVKDTDAKIKCHVVANPSPTVDWLKDGMPFKSNERCVVESDGIMCRPITEMEEGQYVCRARVTATGRIAETQIRVEVGVVPKIDSLQSEYATIEDERIIMTCSATGKPVPEVKWLSKDNVDLSTVTGYIVDPRTGELVIEKAGQEDDGIFTCRVENSAGFDSMETRLSVVGKPKVKDFANVTAVKGRESKITCRVYARPNARITLTKKDSQREFEENQQYDDRIIVETRQEGDDQVFVVTIREVRDDDDGLYLCSARNAGGAVSAVAHLTVEFAPVFDLMPDAGRPIKSWEGNTVNLTCVSRSIPNASIEWIPLGETSMDVQRDQHIRQIGNGPISILEIRTVGNLYYREYKCKATNAVGTNQHSIWVEQAFVPKQLQQASVQTITATTASFVIVGPLDDGGMPITHYVVEYQEDGGEVKTRYWPATSEGGMTYVLEKLIPEKRYTFRFATANAVGMGLFSHVQERVMPKKDVPAEPVIVLLNGDINNKRFNSPYADSAEIHWKLPADNGEPINHFQIVYHPNETLVLGSVIHTKHDGHTIIEPYPSTRVVLKNLFPNTLYKVEVRAQNAIGYSAPGQVYVKTAHGTVSNQHQMQAGGIPMEIIIVIAVAAFLVLLVIVDVSCYFVNRCGLLMCICVNLCGKDKDIKEQSLESAKDSQSRNGDGTKMAGENGDDIKEPNEDTPMITGDKEKEALKDAMDNDYHRTKSPHGSKSSIAKDSPV